MFKNGYNGSFRFEDFGLLNKLGSIDDLSQYFDLTNEMYKKQLDLLIKYVEDTQDEEEKEWRYERNEDELTLFGESLPRIIKYSIIGNLYSHIEYSLLEFAKELSKSRQTVGSYGNEFNKHLEYLQKNLIEDVISDDIAKALKMFRLIRNRIIHSNGFVNRESSNIQHVSIVQIVESNPLIDLSEKDQLLITDEYIFNCFELAVNIIQIIHYAIYGKE